MVKPVQSLEFAPLYSVRQVVHTLLERGAAKGLFFTRVKIQKMLYALHGQTLALRDRPLIDEPFEAWEFGPVVASLHRDMKAYGFGNVPPEDNWIGTWERVPDADTETVRMIDVVLKSMGRASGQHLVAWSSVAEIPCHRIFCDNTKRATIENADIQQHFRKYKLVSA